MKRVLIFLAVIVGVAALLAFALVDVIPPRALTATRMQILKTRVLEFARKHGELPSSLSVLPANQARDNSILDGWHREILFEVSTSGILTFRSLGRDGLVGGSGEDADITRSFMARDSQGRWSDNTVGWSEDTFRAR